MEDRELQKKLRAQWPPNMLDLLKNPKAIQFYVSVVMPARTENISRGAQAAAPILREHLGLFVGTAWKLRLALNSFYESK